MLLPSSTYLVGVFSACFYLIQKRSTTLGDDCSFVDFFLPSLNMTNKSCNGLIGLSEYIESSRALNIHEGNWLVPDKSVSASSLETSDSGVHACVTL